jgi:MFS family permease
MKLWAGQTISEFGSQITAIALPLVAILALSATPFQVGVLAALGTLPTLIIGLPAGVWVDRLRRRPILIATNIGRSLLLVSIPLAAWLGRLSLAHLYLVALLTGALTVFFSIADNAYLPALLRREQLVEGNSKLGVSSALAEISGSAVGGGLVQLLTAPLAILVDGVSYLVSAVLLALIRRPEAAPEAPEQPQTMRQDLLEGLRVVWRIPTLRALALSSGLFNFFGNFIGVLYALFVVRELGLSPALLGGFIAFGGVGALVGAALAGRVPRRWGIGAVLGGSLMASAVIGLLIPLAGYLPGTAIPFLIVNQLAADVLIAIYLINDVTLRQLAAQSRLLGRVNATMHFLVVGVGPVGMFIGGALGQMIGLRPTLLIAVVGVFFAGLSIYLSPIRHAHHEQTAV